MDCLAGSQIADLLSGAASPELAFDIDAHVDRCAECRQVLLNLARVIPPSRSQVVRTDSEERRPHFPDESPSFVSRRYRILGLLGQGGMGRVYRAYDRLLGTEVAVKQVRMSPSLGPRGDSVHLSSDAHAIPKDFPAKRNSTYSPDQFNDSAEGTMPTRLGILAEEFRTLATLRHPNIVSVLDYGFDARRQPFYTMEILHAAQPLLAFARGRTALEQVELLVQLLYALAYLHRRGIVHRDLTPSNVLVVNGDEGPVVKVVDFGLAIDIEHEEQRSVAGTILYMAPELLRGEKASELSDLYAVGVMAYQMLAGLYPFRVDRGAAQLLQEILVESPDLSPLPPAMRPVLGQALSKSPTDRQADAATLLRELAAAAGHSLKSEPIATRDSYLLAARFVGRRAELQHLQAALTDAQRGCGSAWLIGGESGVGKSRLLEQLRSGALQEGVLTLRGQARPGGAAYHVWQEVLKLLALQVPLSTQDASAIFTIVPDLPMLLECDVPAPQVLDPSSARLRLFHIVDEMLAQIPETTLVLFEDLQWADSDSLALLAHIAKGASMHPQLIVATYRPEEGARLAETLPQLRNMPLPRLSRPEMEELCDAMLGLGEAAQGSGLLDLIATETEGNAYFIVELMRALVAESGSLTKIGRGELPRSLFAGGIERVLERRLARAPVSARPLLHLAAVAGREIDLILISHLLPHAELQIRELADVGLLELSMQRWRFSHDKLRERVHDSLHVKERQQLHKSIAVALERLYSDDPGHAPQVALHYREAREPQKAARFYALAGEAALRRGAPREASALLEQARILHREVRMPLLAEVQLFRGITEAHFGLGRLREAETALRHLCTLAGTPLPKNEASLWSMLGRLCAELIASRFGLLRSAAITDPEQRAIQAELLAGLGVEEVFVWTDQPELGLLCTLYGMSLEDKLGMEPRRNYHRSALFFILSHTPLRGLCLRYMEQIARRDAGILSGTHAEIDFLRVRALVEINDGQLVRAAEHAEKAVALARLYKDDLALLHSLLQLQLAAAGRDDFPQMLEVSREMEPLALRAENARYVALAYIGQGAAQLNMGEYTDAVVLLEKARAYLPQELGPISESVTLGLLASGYRHLQQFEPAIELAGKALGAVLRSRWTLVQLRHPLVCILDVYLNSPRRESCQSQIETALAKLHTLARRFPQAECDDALFHGIYYWRFGKPNRALRSFRKSIEIAARLGTRTEKAIAQYWFGCFAQSPEGRNLVREGAAPHLRAALATFERVKAAGMVALTRAALSYRARSGEAAG